MTNDDLYLAWLQDLIDGALEAEEMYTLDELEEYSQDYWEKYDKNIFVTTGKLVEKA